MTVVKRRKSDAAVLMKKWAHVICNMIPVCSWTHLPLPKKSRSEHTETNCGVTFIREVPFKFCFKLNKVHRLNLMPLKGDLPTPDFLAISCGTLLTNSRTLTWPNNPNMKHQVSLFSTRMRARTLVFFIFYVVTGIRTYVGFNTGDHWTARVLFHQTHYGFSIAVMHPITRDFDNEVPF